MCVYVGFDIHICVRQVKNSLKSDQIDSSAATTTIKPNLALVTTTSEELHISSTEYNVPNILLFGRATGGPSDVRQKQISFWQGCF